MDELDRAASVFVADLGRVVGGRSGLRRAVFTDRSSLASEAIATRGMTDPVVLEVSMTPSAMHSALTAGGPYDVIIDVTESPEPERIERQERTFLHLRRGGRYLRRARAGSAPSPGLLVIENDEEALPKLRYDELNDVLGRRGLRRDSYLLSLPAQGWDSRCHLTMNVEPSRWRFPRSFWTPELSLRAHDDVLCAPHQVLIMDGFLLPDSYRHLPSPQLNNHWTIGVNDYFARYKKSLAEPVPMPGAYFYLGSEYPQHFGHVMTEQVSRLWAWREAKRRYPALQALVSVRRTNDGLSPFERSIFTAAGIAPEDLVEVRGVVRVEKLLAATPMLVNNFYVHPDITEVWRRIGADLRTSAPVREYPAKVFVSRRAARVKRGCRNLDQVEEFFTRHGFSVVYPEDFNIAEQAMIFDSAKVIAGFAGSGLLNLALCREPKQVIILSSAAYNSHNEYYIASALGHRVSMVWCDPEVDHPPDGWTRRAFHSPFTVDFRRDGPYLDHVLSIASGSDDQALVAGPPLATAGP